MSSFLKSRGLYQSIAFYLGSSWVIIEATNYFINRFNYPDYLSDIVLILLLFGLLSLIIHEWEQYRKQQNHSNRFYYTIQSAIALLAFTLAFFFFEGAKKKSVNSYAPSENEISIAVLPFEDLSPDKLNDWLAEGICDQIIDQLNLVESIDVKSRSASFYFKEKEYDLVQVADMLGVNHVVEGSVIMLDSVLKISVKLINPITGSQIWHQSFTKYFKDIFDIQSEIALTVASKIQSTISKDVVEKISHYPTSNAQAYENLMKGKYHYNLFTPIDNRRAHDYFKSAIELDSLMAEAYVFLGLTYNIYGGKWLGLSPDSAYVEVRNFAEKALNLNPELPIAEFLMANVIYFYDRDRSAGIELASHAFNNANNKDEMIHFYSIMLFMNKEVDKSIELLKAYLQKNSTSSFAYQALGNAYLVKREFKSVFEPCNKALELNPHLIQPKYYIAEAYFGLEDYQTSSKHWDTLYRNVPIPDFLEGLLRSKYYADQKEDAQELMEKLLEQAKIYPTSYNLAKAYATFGEIDSTMKYLERSFTSRDIELVELWRHPAFDPVRSNKKFKKFVQKYNTPELN